MGTRQGALFPSCLPGADFHPRWAGGRLGSLLVWHSLDDLSGGDGRHTAIHGHITGNSKAVLLHRYFPVNSLAPSLSLTKRIHLIIQATARKKSRNACRSHVLKAVCVYLTLVLSLLFTVNHVLSTCQAQGVADPLRSPAIWRLHKTWISQCEKTKNRQAKVVEPLVCSSLREQLLLSPECLETLFISDQFKEFVYFCIYNDRIWWPTGGEFPSSTFWV